MSPFASRCSLGVLLILTAAVLSAVSGCNIEDQQDVAAGDDCDDEGDIHGNLICENGEWTESDLDAGLDSGPDADEDENGDANDTGSNDTGSNDTGSNDADAGCTPESDLEFCQRYDTECGELVENDNCGDARSVDCGEFEDLGCGPLGECLLAEDSDQNDTNVCECPDVDFSQDDAAICDALGYDCGTFDPADRCSLWADQELEEIDCGSCEGDTLCGIAGSNVCGCPCEIDGGCYAEGDASEDNPCMICDPAQSETEFSPAEDDTSCGDNAVCTDGACGCDEGYEGCGEDCVDTDSNLQHCGTCGTECTTGVDGAEPVCATGDCDVECIDDNDTLCTDAGVCTDTSSDDDHCGDCGESCGDNETCDGGTCVCASGYTDCDGSCVDTTASSDHCGGCNISCETYEACSSGDCVENCPGDETVCDGICTDTSTSDQHCGGCNNDCTTDDGWYDLGDLYDCCDDGEACSCQNQEYREYSCDGSSCDYEATDSRVVTSGCASCDDSNACTNSYCSSGSCQHDDHCDGTASNCGCSSCTDCTVDDGWYDTGSTYDCCDGGAACSCQDQEYREYHCDGTSCDYDVTNTQTLTSGCATCNDGNSCTDSYCSGGSCQNDAYCSGSDTSCGCTSCTDCNSSDGWYDTGSSYSCCSGGDNCTCQDQEYRDYYCSGTSCDYSIDDTRTVSSSCSTCDDGSSCTNSYCSGGSCQHDDICDGTATSCGCSSCTDCTGNDGWYDTGSSYDCCDGSGNSCTCQDEEYREYYCSGTSCEYDVTNTNTKTSNCEDCEYTLCEEWSTCSGECPGTKSRQCTDGFCSSSSGTCDTSDFTEEEPCTDCGSDEYCCSSGFCSDNGLCVE